MMHSWSPRQAQVLGHLFDPGCRVLLVSGPVQSGKSVSAIPGFLAWMAYHHSGEDALLCSHSQRQLEGAVVKYARSYSDAMGAAWTRHGQHWTSRSTGERPNRFYPLLGSDASSAERARSFSAAAALIDEATLTPDDFRASVEDRLSRSPAKMVFVTNPAGPAHPLKTGVLDLADDGGPIRAVQFSLNDNPSLSQEYLDSLRRRYHGAQYRRMVLGEWAASEGLVWPNFGRALHRRARAAKPRFILGVDWAHSSVTHAVLLTGADDDQRSWHACDEWRWDGADRGQLSEWEQARMIAEWLDGRTPSRVWVDPTATGLAVALSETLMSSRVMGAANDVEPGLAMVRMRIDDDRLTVDPDRCPHLVREALNWAWDERFADRGEDRPAEGDDHGCDALRYAVYSEASPQPPRIYRPRREDPRGPRS